MPEKKKIGRDFPLAPTSNPQAIDNTYVNKPFVRRDVPKYTNVEADVALFRDGTPYSKKDSALYAKGFKKGAEGDYTPADFLSVKTAYNMGNMEGKDLPKGKSRFYKKGK
jgi:hypothetical protein